MRRRILKQFNTYLFNRDGSSTDVIKNDNGTYTVVGGTADEDLNIYITENGKRTDEVIGQSLTEHSFLDDNGHAMYGDIINPNDQSGQSFLHNEIIEGDPNILAYMPNATGGKKYDFKIRDIKNRGEQTKVQYHYRGMPLKDAEGKIVYGSVRDVGNFGAGYVAGKTGLNWSTVRAGFDALQSVQAGRLATEGAPTQRAERLEYNAGSKKYILNDIGNKVKKKHLTFQHQNLKVLTMKQ